MTKYEFLNQHRRKLLPLTLTVLALVVAVVFRQPLTAWFTGEPVGDTASEAVETRAGDLRIATSLVPDTPRQKGNTVEVAVKDASGAPVEGAEVEVGYVMPAMGSMQEMRGSADVKDAGEGLYRGSFDLPMAGSWTLEVSVNTAQTSAEAAYSFTVGSKGLNPVGGAMASGVPASRGPRVPELEKQELPAAAFESLQTAFAAYEQVRARLAADDLGGLPPRAKRLAEALGAAKEGLEHADSAVAQCIEQAQQAATAIASAGSLEAARAAFGDVSAYLVALGATDERLAEGRHVFECPMVKDGFNKWIQATPVLENPYMGQRMLACGSKSDWTIPSPSELAEGGHEHASGEVAFYTCPMHPSVKQAGPGTCPICSMDLTPVTQEEVKTGILFVDARRRQLIGVRTGEVERRPLESTIRAIGRVVYDQTQLVDVSTQYEGWIRDLKVDEIGQKVKKGQRLFSVYSPEVYAAQQDLLVAARSSGSSGDYLLDAARERLRLLDVPNWAIDRIIQTGKPMRALPVVSPTTGYVIEKSVVEGAAIKPGEKLFRIAGLDRVWVEAEVYESELSLVEVGQRATVSLPYIPGRRFTGKVALIHPFLERDSRTGRIRVELPNQNVELKPDMYANVTLHATKDEESLMVPASAVVYAGPRRLVFLDLGEGKLKPQEVTTGRRSGDFVEVLEGLDEGDEIVTSGNFLIAAESRLKSAEGQW